MADNTLNFDLDAPAVPTLTLDPTPAAVPQEEKPAAAPAPEAQVSLTPEEQAERKALREEYIADWRRSTIDVLENTYIDHGDGRVTKLPKKRT